MDSLLNLFKSKFVKSVLLLAGGAAFAQVLNIVLSPVITRIYSPDEYGILILFSALLGMVSSFSSLSYDSSIPIADDDKKAVNVLFLCLIIILLSTSLLTIVIFFFGDFIIRHLDAGTLEEYKYFIPVGFFATGLYTTLSKWSFRGKDFGNLAKTKYSQSIIGNTVKISLGLFSFGPIGLILGRILGESAGSGALVKPLLTIQKNLLKNINIKDIIWSAKRYARFPIYTAPTFFLLSVSGQIPIILIAKIYGQDVVGLYGLALSITFLPMTLIGKSIEDVFYGEAASMGKENPQKIKELSNKILKKLFMIGLVPLIVLTLCGPFLFSLVFGENWYDAGVYSRLITIYVFTHFIFHPISSVFYIFEQQQKPLILNSINLLLVLIVFGLAYKLSLNSYSAVLIFSLAKTLVELLKYILARNMINNEIRMMSKQPSSNG
ncbi:lipopolysaccharide biosynthesis protein [Rossellomorea vietnamensis]|uniref:lipopolysaccharide biosynthesis protein n=1 Tax=Rossellomorea vietnamensis TaxID=218284 RepID=UPI001E436A99|nr:oligosaccharide flippase family protein [Rossellomorea vietnamensis]MCC5803218.1 oligosaccharide flippase family protein [Rossellomorea vietnamensis]